MKIIIEDYQGNGICSFECKEFRNPINCNVADIDEDEDGIHYMRIQIEEE